MTTAERDQLDNDFKKVFDIEKRLVLQEEVSEEEMKYYVENIDRIVQSILDLRNQTEK